jgi:hypothetical protein
VTVQPHCEVERLPYLIKQAMATLDGARTSADVLEARGQADLAYVAAKTAARLSRIKDAHDTVQRACHKTMAEALMIEGRASCRLADEYDAAQARREVRSTSKKSSKDGRVGYRDIGLTHHQIYAARIVRDAEVKSPGTVRRIVEERLQAAKEPRRADVMRECREISRPRKHRKRRETPHLDEAFAGDAVETFDVDCVWRLIERARAKYSDSPDVKSLCAVAERYIALHLRVGVRARRHGDVSLGANGGGGVEAHAP